MRPNFLRIDVGMYRRWLLLLAVLFILGLSWTLYFENKVQGAWSVWNECAEYFDSLDDSWTAEADVYFRQTCDHQNPFSRVRL